MKSCISTEPRAEGVAAKKRANLQKKQAIPLNKGLFYKISSKQSLKTTLTNKTGRKQCKLRTQG